MHTQPVRAWNIALQLNINRITCEHVLTLNSGLRIRQAHFMLTILISDPRNDEIMLLVIVCQQKQALCLFCEQMTAEYRSVSEYDNSKHMILQRHSMGLHFDFISVIDSQKSWSIL